MSDYSDISKKIGNGGTTSYPNLEEAIVIISLAEEGDINAFEKLFRIQRFSPIHLPEDDREVADLCHKGFLRASEVFKKEKVYDK